MTLECRACGATYAEGPDEPWRCDCGHALDFAERALPDPRDVDASRGLWAFESFLPAPPDVSLGEGFTPLTDAPAWDAQFKLDFVFPSGSYKDRGATVLLSRAAELGVERVLEDSSGNAGAAVAQYAARAGIDADIYVPADAKPSKLRAIEAAGATPVRIEGTRSDVTDACVEAVAAGEGWYASHAWNPAFYAGTETFAYELAVQRDRSAPDAVVLPLGHGTLFLGAYRGFRRLHEAGWTDSIPRLYGVQAAGVAPIANRLHADGDGENDVPDGIQIADPARADQILDAIDATGGDAIALDADTTKRELERLHDGGFYCEPTSAVAPAGLRAYRERGEITAGEDVVVPLTGSGLKT
ncbi:pyridoxal-phosphate dependent enzyme [Salarchaeum sp. JOR-1]|uniref:pyridoxal-phosphate dependent enzyme n=1 Tax=Salarchaeum sp. JOR-1 TaxID=2599399 RepID=UPI00119835A4|nr:pyridoxal-phosphate dependent enzyme [Salarchaeum sp. JOR-1]QDX40403.1 pyridoxal-phosphate dependent enzyme [Salarchaeum sp. JOR-1]